MNRRHFLGLLALFVGLHLTLWPMRQAQAIAPVVPILVAVGTAAAESAAVDATATAIVTLIGAVASWLIFKDSRDGSALRVPTTPQASSVPTSPSAPATKPGSYSYIPSYECPNYSPSTGACYARVTTCVDSTHCASHYQNWCLPGVSCWKQWNCTGTSCSYVSSGGTQVGPFLAYEYDINVASNTFGCPAGYTGNPCTLSDAKAVTPDGNKDFGRSGQVLSAPPATDADNAKQIKGAVNSDGSMQVGGKNSAGHPVVVVVQPTADGGSKVVLSEQKSNADGSVYVDQTTLTVNPSGVVTAAQSARANASLAVDSDTQKGTLTANPSTVSNPDGSTSTIQSQSTAPQTIQFPSDYARAGEAAAAASAINTSLGPKLDKLLETSPAPSDPTLPDPGQYTDFGSTFNSLTGWSVPGHSSQCPTSSFSVFGRTFTIDSHCTLWADHSQALQAAMMVVWTIAALWVVLRA